MWSHQYGEAIVIIVLPDLLLWYPIYVQLSGRLLIYRAAEFGSISAMLCSECHNMADIKKLGMKKRPTDKSRLG